MALARITPRHLSSLFDDSFGGFAPLLRAASDATFSEGSLRPALDIKEQETGYKVTAEVPGIKREDLKLSFGEGGRVLSLSGSYKEERKEEDKDKDGKHTYWLTEISRGSFARSVRFPHPIDETAVKARLNDGLLEIEVPKAKQQSSGKNIAIE